MKTFKQHLDNNKKKSLHVFDIDDTLLHTNAKIHVKDKNNKHVESLNNQEFNDHHLKHGHKYDFSEFRSAQKFHDESHPIHKMIKKVKDLSKDKHNHVIFNTARANFDDKNKFLHTFKKHGIDMKKIHVIRAGNLNREGLPAEKKAVVIHGYIKKHKYKDAHMYDDSKTNLHHFLKLKNNHPNTEFHAHHVSGDGTTKKITEEIVALHIMFEEVDKKDTITFDIPLIIRVLELAREDIKSDMDLHRVVERLIDIRNRGTLTMDDYDFIANLKEEFVKKIEEDGMGGAAMSAGPTNVVSGVAGIGAQGPNNPQSEPGVDLRNKKKHNPILLQMGKRKY
jgi:hypothetical protein